MLKKKLTRMSIMDGAPPKELCNALHSDIEATQIYHCYSQSASIKIEIIFGAVFMFLFLGIGAIFIVSNIVVFAILAVVGLMGLPLCVLFGAYRKKKVVVAYCNSLNDRFRHLGIVFECNRFPYMDFMLNANKTIKLEDVSLSNFKSEQIDKLLNVPLPNYSSQSSSSAHIKYYQSLPPVNKTSPNSNNIGTYNNNSTTPQVTYQYQTSQNNSKFFANKNNQIANQPQYNDNVQNYSNIIIESENNVNYSYQNNNPLISKQSHAYKY